HCGSTVDLTIANSTLTGNHAGRGGAVSGQYGCVVTLTDVVVEDNTAVRHGGALYGDGADLVVTDAVFERNDAPEEGGAVVWVLGDVTMTDVLLARNTAGTEGGGLYFQADPGNEVELTRVDFDENSVGPAPGGRGGALYVRETAITLDDCDLTYNYAGDHGGGLFARNASVVVTRDVRLIGNEAAVGSGGGMTIQEGATLDASDTDFTNNEAARSGGGLMMSAAGTVEVTRGDFAGNTPHDVWNEDVDEAYDYGAAASFVCADEGCDPPG
ncbi:MAG: putative outer membrane repeat protein, partial [Myxococcota bacterium]